MIKSIIKTVAYFDIFDFPLTALELWKFLKTDKPCALRDVVTALDAPELKSKIGKKNGFIFLAGRGEIVRLRLDRYLIAERKFKKALIAAKFLKFIPGIRMAAVSNTLAMSHARDESDIDFFIVTRPGSLWKSRLLAVAPFAILGLRPKPSKSRDGFCFSFFVSETALDMSNLKIKPEDPHLLYWLASFAPIYDPDGLIEALWDANPWIKESLPNCWPVRLSQKREIKAKAGRFFDSISPHLSFREALARAVQMLILPQNLSSVMNLDDRVIVTDEILKFHENDRRADVCRRYDEKCQMLFDSYAD